MSGDNVKHDRKGGCLCGAVRYEVRLDEVDAHVCHCGLCRRWSGGPAIAVKCDPDVAFQKEEGLVWYDSSEWAQRGFCNQCGSHLFCRVKEGYGDHFDVVVGSLDDDSGLRVGKHIYIDKKPPYYDFKDDCPRLTEQEFLAQFQDG